MLRRLLLLGVMLASMMAVLPAFAQDDATFDLLMNEAINAYFEGNYDSAIDLIDDALEVNSRSGFAYDWRGWIHYMNRDFDIALRDLDRAIELDDSDAIFYIDRAMIHAMLGSDEQALEDYDVAVDLNADYAFSAERAVSDVSSTEFLIRNYTIAAETNPQDYIALAFRAAQYANIGLFEEAVADYQAALELQPAFTAIEDDLDDARALLQNPDGRTVYCVIPNFDVVPRIQAGDTIEGSIDDVAFVDLRCVRIAGAPATLRVTMQALNGDLEPSIAVYDSALTPLMLPETSPFIDDEIIIEADITASGDYLVLFTRTGLDAGTSSGDFSAIVSVTGSDEQLVSSDTPAALAAICADATVFDINKCARERQ